MKDKFLACLFGICVLGVFTCMHAESTKSASQEKPVYVLESDIINFDYSKLSYPSNSISVGIKTNDTMNERKPGKEVSDGGILHEMYRGLVTFVWICVAGLACYSWLALVPSMIVMVIREIIIVVRKKRFKMENNC